MKYRATIRAGSRCYSEILDLDEELQDWDEVKDQFDFDWERYTRPILIPYGDLDELNGDHILFGWFESIMQSDRSPWFALTECNNTNIVLEFD